jgi:[ribosomal protein S18]-alanine N-acetyltransferase
MTRFRVTRGSADDLARIMPVMHAGFDPRFGEAWTREQCLSLLTMPGTTLFIAQDDHVSGFAMARMLVGESELMLIAVDPSVRRNGIATALLTAIREDAKTSAVQSIFLEVRNGNPAAALYTRFGFSQVGVRARYYRGNSGETFDALTFRLDLT